MSSCKGRGECLEQRNEFEYTRVDCSRCELQECHNFKVCGQKRPQWVLHCNSGMCINCAISLGKLTILHKVDDCPICLMKKDLIRVSCGKHTTCIDCWKNWSTTCEPPVTCPLCREPIWK